MVAKMKLIYPPTITNMGRKKFINMGKARKNVTQPDLNIDLSAVNEEEEEHLVEIDFQNAQVKWLRNNLLFGM